MAIAEVFCGLGWNVFRFDLPFRRKRPRGSPFPAAAKEDREGIRQAVDSIRTLFSGMVLVGGHSYGGRQASMLAAEDPQVADGLLLLSYPLHPPNKPDQLRTAHFPDLRTKTLFFHGSRDPFGSVAEMLAATAVIPAGHEMHVIQGAGHELGRDTARTAQLIFENVRHAFGAP